MVKKNSKGSLKALPKSRHPIDLEVEVKIRCDDVDRLLSSNLTVELEEDRHLEDNFVFPLPDGKLRNGQYLRIRHTGDGEGSGRRRAGLLTYKGKPKRIAGGDGGKNKGKKVREEIETTVGQPPKLVKILKRLGLRRSFRYQKYRTIYVVTLPDGRSLFVMFDETPIGNFLELEGDASVIEAAAAALGYEQDQFVAESYVDMHVARCSTRGEPTSDMLFEATKVRQAMKRAGRKQRASKASSKGRGSKLAAAKGAPVEEKPDAKPKKPRSRAKGKSSKQKAKVGAPERTSVSGKREKSASKKSTASKDVAPRVPKGKTPSEKTGNGSAVKAKKARTTPPDSVAPTPPSPGVRHGRVALGDSLGVDRRSFESVRAGR